MEEPCGLVSLRTNEMKSAVVRSIEWDLFGLKNKLQDYKEWEVISTEVD